MYVVGCAVFGADGAVGDCGRPSEKQSPTGKVFRRFINMRVKNILKAELALDVDWFIELDAGLHTGFIKLPGDA